MSAGELSGVILYTLVDEMIFGSRSGTHEFEILLWVLIWLTINNARKEKMQYFEERRSTIFIYSWFWGWRLQENMKQIKIQFMNALLRFRNLDAAETVKFENGWYQTMIKIVTVLISALFSTFVFFSGILTILTKAKNRKHWQSNAHELVRSSSACLLNTAASIKKTTQSSSSISIT